MVMIRLLEVRGYSSYPVRIDRAEIVSIHDAEASHKPGLGGPAARSRIRLRDGRDLFVEQGQETVEWMRGAEYCPLCDTLLQEPQSLTSFQFVGDQKPTTMCGACKNEWQEHYL